MLESQLTSGVEELLKTYKLPMLIPTITPIRSFLFKVNLLMRYHGRAARRMSDAPDQADLKL